MCLAKDGESPKVPSAESPGQSPRSPWAKLLNRQSLKPRLPRKITASAKVNLNRYWSKFGELLSSRGQEAEVLVLPLAAWLPPALPEKPPPGDAGSWLSNGNRFEIIPVDGVEVTENLANEVREICYSKKDCFVCSLS